MAVLTIDHVDIGYSSSPIVKDLSVEIPKGKITALIGPNGCGKSTLLKAVARLLKIQQGAVYLDGKALHEMNTKSIAKRMAILPQSSIAPGGLTVIELVSYGRFPYQSGMGTLRKEDYGYIHWAIEVTGLKEYQDRSIEALSGGQRQRVWIAMALAQGTDILILDEPTTYLDLAHQLDVLLLLKKLNEEEGRTIVMVLHDLNHASRFSDFMMAIRDGQLVVSGSPHEVMTEENLEEIFNIKAHMAVCPYSNNPICLTYHTAKM
ncbi:ABC transporter ATP-binding protein [Lysinibacillus sphaericus]|uniref:ABC transporter ATP-binding protein n=1 Tax=Lysinibacillus sphaericus TaxID=1421 RepID=A0A544UMY2_LYSSH|nr:ABC transporter ATP-binding protein [Lysinibacillus sp. SDF0037]TQR35202.1 ABC transporter ATP-binding protein [Lysinibacillus sp. SDF0037]